MSAPSFRSGVIEGFYGRPWTEPQRLRMLSDLAAWGLNTYLYAPKDDLAHRTLWRRPYEADELAALARLVGAADRAGVDVVYGVAPGLDLRFADEGDATALHDKVAQALELGVRSVALLFDDVPRELRPEDAERFGSLAAAQAHVAGSLLAQLREAGGGSLLFCPTDYCAAMARPSVADSPYLQELGERLEPEIEVFWTGPEVVSRTIAVDGVREAAAVLRRKPLVWDNLHANDYDLRRLHLGPYSGRPAGLRAEVSGVLLNANNEPGANAVPLMTLATYLRHDGYDPRSAFLEAVARWAERLELAGAAGEGAGALEHAGGGPDAERDADRHGPVATAAASAEDVAFLADFLYLPFEHGPAARAFLEDIAYLQATPAAAWGATFDSVAGAAKRLAGLVRALTRLRDRELLAELHPYVLDVLIEVGGAAQRVAARRYPQAQEPPRDGIGNVRRGGFAGELSRLLDASGRRGGPRRG